MSFFNNFISNQTEFNRNLDMKEYRIFNDFPNVSYNSVKYLGLGAVRPSAENCIKYHCLPSSTSIFNASNGSYLSTVIISDSDVELMQMVWDRCHSKDYNCNHSPHFGATFNCIGWSLGITKWLNPGEVTSYLNDGFSKEAAIKKFLHRSNEIYPISHISNIESISDKFNFFQTKKPSAILNNTVAFYFNDEDECLHGARYIKNFHGNYLNKWTSKLGSGILVSHALEGLMGEDSPYGDSLYFFGITDEINEL